MSVTGYELRKKPRKESVKEKRHREWNRLNSMRLPGVNTIIDVGVGTSGTHYFWRHFPDKYFLLIDPLVESEVSLKQLNGANKVFEAVALGDVIEKKNIILDSNLNRSSLLSRSGEDGNLDQNNFRTVRVDLLDNVTSKHNTDPPYGIKIDTEGFELKVLKGGRETLSKTVFLIMEVRYRKSFDDSYSFYELMQFITENNFVPFDIIGQPDDRKMDLVCVNNNYM